MLVRVDERGRVTLPKEIRKKLHLKENDMLMLNINEDGLLVCNPVIAIKRPKNFTHSEIAAIFDNPKDLSNFLKSKSKSVKVGQK